MAARHLPLFHHTLAHPPTPSCRYEQQEAQLLGRLYAAPDVPDLCAVLKELRDSGELARLAAGSTAAPGTVQSKAGAARGGAARAGAVKAAAVLTRGGGAAAGRSCTWGEGGKGGRRRGRGRVAATPPPQAVARLCSHTGCGRSCAQRCDAAGSCGWDGWCLAWLRATQLAAGPGRGGRPATAAGSTQLLQRAARPAPLRLPTCCLLRLGAGAAAAAAAAEVPPPAGRGSGQHLGVQSLA